MTQSNKTHRLVESAMMVGLATVLSLITLYQAPLGGKVTLLSMVPVLLAAYKNGPAWGFGTAFVYSLVQLLLGLNNVALVPTPAGIALCILLDYILPFTALGVVSLFGRLRIKPTASITLGAFCACLLRTAFHILSGAVVWYEITKAGNWNDFVHTVGMWTYTTVYNLSYMLPEIIITLATVPLLYSALGRFNRTD